MNCPSCGATIPEDANFCGLCGHRLSAEQERMTAEPAEETEAEHEPDHDHDHVQEKEKDAATEPSVAAVLGETAQAVREDERDPEPFLLRSIDPQVGFEDTLSAEPTASDDRAPEEISGQLDATLLAAPAVTSAEVSRNLAVANEGPQVDGKQRAEEATLEDSGPPDPVAAVEPPVKEPPAADQGSPGEAPTIVIEDESMKAKSVESEKSPTEPGFKMPAMKAHETPAPRRKVDTDPVIARAPTPAPVKKKAETSKPPQSLQANQASDRGFRETLWFAAAMDEDQLAGAEVDESVLIQDKYRDRELNESEAQFSLREVRKAASPDKRSQVRATADIGGRGRTSPRAGDGLTFVIVALVVALVAGAAWFLLKGG